MNPEQQQVAVEHCVEPTFSSDDHLVAPLSAVKLAKNKEFSRLLVAVALRPRLASACDKAGMTALHWVCSHPTAPTRVVLAVARAHIPATAMRNLVGLLPLHLAVKNRLALEAMQALLHVYPQAIAMRTPDGKTPLMLAKQTPVAPNAVLSMLRESKAQVGHEMAASTDMSTPQWAETTPEPRQIDKIEARHSNWFRSAKAVTQDDTSAMRTTPHASPPRWALASRCRLCATKFGYFRQRHHCRNCGVSVCGRHSRHRVPLKHLGLHQPQRVCGGCFDDLQNQLNARALERVTRTGGAYPYIDNTGYTCTSAQPRSKSNYSEPLQRDNNIENGFIPVSAPYNWSSPASETAEALQPTLGSMFLSVEPAQKKLTVLERQRLLREQKGLFTESEPISKSRPRRCRLHSSELDKSLSVQRLSEVTSSCSSDAHELEQRLLHLMEAKRELGAETARMERNLEAIADKYRDSGYSCSPEYEEEDEEAEIAATMAFLNAGKRLSSTAELLEDPAASFDLAFTHHELGENLLSKGDFAGAVTELQRSVDLDDKKAVVWLDLAKAFDGTGADREAAEEAVRRALELEPTSIGALSLLGKLLHLRGDHDDAILVFRQALELQCPRAATYK